MPEASAFIESSELKTYKRPVNFDEIVLKALYGRMDPATRTVTPKWRTLASTLGVSPVTLGRYIQRLKEDGRIAMVTEDEPAPCASAQSDEGRPSPVWLPNLRKRYIINESVDAEWVESVAPRFERVHVSRQKRRYKTTKAAMDAVADEHLAERCRLVMADFLRRMDPATHAVAPRTKDLSQRIGRKLSTAEYVRVVRTFKAAGLLRASRLQDASGVRPGDYVFILDTEAIAKIDYLELARTYRLKTVRAVADGTATLPRTTSTVADGTATLPRTTPAHHAR